MPSPLRLDLDGAALVANWRLMRDRNPQAACGAAIKADGYGLGARGVADRLIDAGCRDFFVATWAEAAALGPLGEGIALSVLHGVRAEDMAAALARPARPVLDTPAQVARWKAAGGGACDVMVDTGMNRLGLTPAEAMSGLLDGMAVATLHSHLACADEPGDAINETQRAAFAEVRARVPAARYSLANSAGVLLGPDYAFDLTRPGLALYGGVPVAGFAGIRQVVRPHVQVLQVREVAAGQSVGYGAQWRASAPTRIAILNIGYADGFFRGLGEGLVGKAGGRTIEVLGRVSMDLLAVRAPPGIGEGDWIELPFALPDLAARSGMSQYELLTSLGPRYQRRWT